MNKQRTLLITAALIGAVSTFLPWISLSAGAFGYSVSQSRNGFHGMGLLYFLIILSVAVISMLGDRSQSIQKSMRPLVMGGGALALISLIISYAGIKDDVGAGYGMVSSSIGMGLILSLAAALAIVAIPFFFKAPGENLADDFSSLTSAAKSMQNGIKLPSMPSVKTEKRMDELEKLITWRAEGKITEAEFQELKSKII